MRTLLAGMVVGVLLAGPQVTSGPPLGARRTSPIDGQTMVWIPPGEFLMGACPDCNDLAEWGGSPSDAEGWLRPERPQHPVRIERGFWLDATEVTNAAYQRFVKANADWQKGQVDLPCASERVCGYLMDWNGSSPPEGKAQHPVAFVTWPAARAYCEWAGKRLPTEAEWEYAARAGTTTAYWWGNAFDPTRANRGKQGTLPVGDERRTNPWGLSDILGNVWEWTSSLHRPYPYDAGDGRENPSSTGGRVLRGGCWLNVPWALHASTRSANSPQTAFSRAGFRCAQ